MRLSIITINYNNLIGLQRTYGSVICQTFQDYEWIIIDGGSTDGSRDFIERHQGQFTYWCSEPDKGVYNAMNKGIEHACGDYLLFLNSGDALYHKDVLQQLFARNYDADIVAGNVIRMDNKSLLRFFDPQYSILSLLIVDTLNHQGSFIKRHLFSQNRYDEELKIVADWKFWLEMIVFKGSRVQFVDDIISIQDMTGISRQQRLLDIEERQRVLDDYFPRCVQEEIVRYREMKDVLNEKNVLTLKECLPYAYILLRKLTSLLAKMVR